MALDIKNIMTMENLGLYKIKSRKNGFFKQNSRFAFFAKFASNRLKKPFPLSNTYIKFLLL